MQALLATLPERYWIEINERLVPFGKFVCTGERPRCSTCALIRQCRQVGVDRASVTWPAAAAGAKLRRRQKGQRPRDEEPGP